MARQTLAYSEYSDAPGTGFTAGACVPPNNYSFYCEDERYKPVKSPDGRFFSEFAPPDEATSRKQELLSLRICSFNHTEEELGGPTRVDISPDATVDELRTRIQEKCGVPRGLQRLSFACKLLDDPSRQLKKYGIAYWRNHLGFDWPITIS